MSDADPRPAERLIVAGRVRVKAELRQEAVDLALAMAAASEGEPGCLSYRFYGDLADPCVFFIFEEWRDEAALAAHFRTPHLLKFQQHIPRLLAEPPSIRKYAIGGIQSV